MTKKIFSRSIFIFRRDLRLYDNTALIAACRQSEEVIPVFICTPEQIGAKNKYKSDHALQFMRASLQELADDLEAHGGRLYVFHGHMHDIVKRLIKELSVDAVFCNYDYTPYARSRDAQLEHICQQHNITFCGYHDALLNEPGKVKGSGDKPYQVFTPFWKASRVLPIQKPVEYRYTNFYRHAIADTVALSTMYDGYNEQLAVKGGRKEAKKIMAHLSSFADYAAIRDTPALDTTLLSAHNKFGTISIRELYWHMYQALGASAGDMLVRQLYWRDFYYHVAYFWPEVFGRPFHRQYENLAWRNNQHEFELWCQGKTGFPIVDAGMRQLNETGFMHNRVRMIVASFLTKDLLIDWQWGERYFAQKLVDYDPCVNNGNWQWAASTGCDPQPYFRIFNPWLQQKKFDPECVYIKRWVPELAHISPKEIHAWYDYCHRNKGYGAPIVDHNEARNKALFVYKSVTKE